MQSDSDLDTTSDDVLELVRKAWDGSAFELQVDVALQVQKHAPKLFRRWTKEARVPHFTRNLAKSALPALKKALFQHHGRLAVQVLKAYFTDCRTNLNDAFLGAVEAAELDEDSSDPDEIAAVLARVAQSEQQNVLPGSATLFVAALELVAPKWFSPSSNDGIATPSDSAPPVSQAPDSAPVSSVLSPTSGPIAAPCTRERIAVFERWLGPLEQALEKAKSSVEAIKTSGDHDQIGDLGEAGATLKDAHRRLDRAVARFAQCPSPCPAAELGCAPLRQVAERERRTVRDFLSLRGVERRLDEVLATESERARELATRVASLRADIGEVEPESDRMIHSLYGARLLSDQLAADCDELQTIRDELLTRELEAASSLLARLRPRAALEAARSEELVAIESQFKRDEGLSAMRELHRRLSTLDSAWAPSRTIEDLATSVERALDATSLMELGRSLLVVHPLRGLALLWLVQRTHDFTFLAGADIGSFIALWLDTVAASVDVPAVRCNLPALLAESWLKDLDAGDASGCSLPLRGLLVAASHAGAEAETIAHRFDAFDAFAESEFPTLALVARSVRDHARWSVVGAPIAEAVDRARASVERELDAVFLSVMTKSRKAHRFRGELFDEAKPVLEEVWESVCALDHPTLELVQDVFLERHKELERIIDRACDNDRSETFFRNEIRSAIAAVRSAVEDFVTIRAHAAGAPTEIVASALEAECDRLGAVDPRWRPVWKLVEAILAAREDVTGLTPLPTLEHLFAREPELVCIVPELARDISQRPAWEPQPSDVQRFVMGLATRPIQARVLTVLTEAHCADALVALCDTWNLSQESREQYIQERSSLENLANELVGLAPYLEGCTYEDVADAASRRKFAFVLRQVTSARERRLDADKRMAASAQEALRELRKQIDGFLQLADESTMDDEWKEAVRRQVQMITAHIGRAQSHARTAAEKTMVVNRVREGLDIVRDTIQHSVRDLAALESVARSLEPRAAVLSPRTKSGELDLSAVEARVDIRSRLWSAFVAMKKGVAPNDDKLVLRDFCKVVELYASDEVDPRFVLSLLGGSTLHSAKTSFHRPGSDYFSKPVRVHLLPATSRLADEIHVLHEQLSKDADEFCIVLLAADALEVRRKLSSDVQKGRVTIVDDTLLKRILQARRPGAPLRQALRRTISVAETSPFKSEGYVSEGRDIYVGRKEMLQQIVNGDCWLLWGGRRSGKTSLLHAAGAAYRAKGWNVIYESMESIPSDPIDDLDLHAARLIAVNLGWSEPPASLEAFATRFEEHCRNSRTCLLLDELDAYLRPHLDAGRAEYPFIRHLRRLRTKLKDNFVCIFAGFKHLYRVVELEKRPDDSSYPWHNFARATKPLTRLTSEETTELVREGFESVLGIELEPSVPLRIFTFTGGHPASVQRFCNCVLQRIAVSTRSDQERRVTEADVQGAFDESVDHPGEQPFIYFVEKTLAMNLGALEKIIVYVIAADLIGRHGPAASRFDKRAVITRVDEWFGSCAREKPLTSDYDRAFGFLRMTGMLDVDGEQVRMAFPSYANVLVRLEEAEVARIDGLIRSFVRSAS